VATTPIDHPATDDGLADLALVTGSAGGIGTSIVRTLLDTGIDVVGADLALTPAQSKLTPHASAQLFTHPVDVSDQDSVEALFAATYATFGRYPNLLINNAGVQTWKPLIELELAEWEKTLATNLTGCFLLTRNFARHLISEKLPGTIVNIGSGCNKQAFPNLVDYTASKGGVEMFTKSAALELGPHRIRVNCIAPGAIETDRTVKESGNYAQSWAALTPLGRVGQPDDVAAAVLMLCSKDAQFVTGQTLNVDGGLFSRAIWPTEH